LFISINTNDKNKTITLFDSGVGMTRQEMIDNLGTIAKSGTQNFLKNMDSSKGNTESLIGQFGVGFYSSFMAGEKIEVISRTQDSKKASLWVSDGSVNITKLFSRVNSKFLMLKTATSLEEPRLSFT